MQCYGLDGLLQHSWDGDFCIYFACKCNLFFLSIQGRVNAGLRDES